MSCRSAPLLKLHRLAAVGVCLFAISHAAEQPRALYVEGYAGESSYRPGDEAAIHVSTSAPKYSVEIARIGDKREVVWTAKDLPGHEYHVPENASSHGCGWPMAFKVPVAANWRSGYYLVTFRAERNQYAVGRLRLEDQPGRFVQRGRHAVESDAYFVVRSAQPGRDTKILIQLTTNTYNAYNDWGGFSLYSFNGYANFQGNRVSFHRPGVWPSASFTTWELPFVAWAERNGYTLDYAVNGDLEFRPELLAPYRLVLSLGQDAYWSGPMRDCLEDFIANGGNVAFFGGNSVAWQVRSEEGGHALVGWRQNYRQDPVWATGNHATLTTAWSHHLLQRPENTLTGGGTLWGGMRKFAGQFMDEPAEFTVHQPEHWVFAGTGLRPGATFGGKDTIVGYECSGCELVWRDGLPYPTHNDGTPEGFTVLATCPARWHPENFEWYERWEKGRTGNAVMGVYTRGGTVFTAGTTDWAHGLRGRDPIVERITKNVLDRLSK